MGAVRAVWRLVLQTEARKLVDLDDSECVVGEFEETMLCPAHLINSYPASELFQEFVLSIAISLLLAVLLQTLNDIGLFIECRPKTPKIDIGTRHLSYVGPPR